MGQKPLTTMDKLRMAVLGTNGRGSLYRWLRRHHDELVDLLDQVPRPDWKKITEALSEENLLDAAGNRPTPERVRQTWVKVRKDVEATRGRKSGSQASAKAISEHVKQSVGPVRKAASEAKDVPPNDAADDLSSSLNAGRGWLPKDNKRR